MEQLTLTLGTGLDAVTADRPESWHKFTGGGLPCPVRVRVDLDGEGKPVCTGVLLADDGEVSTRTLRAVPLRRLMTYLAADLATAHGLTAGEVEFHEATAAIVAELVTLGADAADGPPRPAPKRGRPRLADEELAAFMRRYHRISREYPDEPILAVAEDRPKGRDRMSRASVHRRLNAARERGITGQETDQ